ncbi:MAG: hypothetical protein ACREAY_00430 [Nitrososphaera sp.]
MLLSQSKITELYVELREFGVDVDALKQAGLSEDALDVLYYAIKVVDSHRAKVNHSKNNPKFNHPIT